MLELSNVSCGHGNNDIVTNWVFIQEKLENENEDSDQFQYLLKEVREDMIRQATCSHIINTIIYQKLVTLTHY